MRLSTIPFGLLLCVVAGVPLAAQSSAPIRGDVTGDGKITSADALAILLHTVDKPVPSGYKVSPNGDNNGDGKITALDALVGLSFVVGKDVSQFPINSPLQIVASITVTPPSAIVLIGEKAQLAAKTFDENGEAMTAAVTWASADPAVVSVDAATGVVTAKAVGLTTITASAGDKKTSVTIAADQIADGSVTANYKHACALTTAGSAICWGSNNQGQLGDGTQVNRLTPVAVSGGHVFKALTTGSNFTCGLTTAGAAYCWGSNGAGSLGDGTTTTRFTPTLVSGGKIFKSISAGLAHVVAVTETGEAWAWGNNFYGLGDGSTAQRLAPVAVTMPAGVTFETVSTGAYHSLAISSTGAAYGWGSNIKGELGDGTTTARTTPVAVKGGLLFRAIAAGERHGIGITTDGKAYSWGDVGGLGDGSKFERYQPGPVSGDLLFRHVRANSNATIAMTFTGQLYVWGTTPGGYEPTPAQVAPGMVFRSVDAGPGYVVAMAQDGSLWAWGNNGDGQLGDGTTTFRHEPTLVGGTLPASRVEVAAAGFAMITKGSSATMTVSVSRIGGFTGDVELTLDAPPGITGTFDPAVISGTTLQSTLTIQASSTAPSGILRTRIRARPAGRFEQFSPASVIVSGSAIGEGMVAAGGSSCGLTKAGQAYCWGPILGAPSRVETVPTPVPGNHVFASIAVGHQHACALTPSGAAYCWGVNEQGNLGVGSTNIVIETPTPVTGGHTFRAISAGGKETCALTTTGAAYCWGTTLGTVVSTPTAVPGGLTFHTISVGAGHKLALTSDGTPYGWGINYSSQLGVSGQTIVTTPIKVSEKLRFIAISAGGNASGALTADGTPYMWGKGLLGTATTETDQTILEPTPVPNAGPYRAISVGAGGTAALDYEGNIVWWGHYLLKDATLDECMQGITCGTYLTSKTPRTSRLSVEFTSVAAGDGHSLAVDEAGAMAAWGNNLSGQLGKGDLFSIGTPHTPTLGYNIDMSSPVWLEPGATVTSDIHVTRTGGFTTAGLGFPGDISLSLVGALPSGVTAAFNPAIVKPGVSSSTLSMTAASNATPGSVSLSVSAASPGATNRTASLSAIVPEPVPATGYNLVCPFSATKYKGYYCMDNGTLAPGKWDIKPLHTPVGGSTWWVESTYEVCVQWDANNGRSRVRFSGGLGGKPASHDGNWGILVRKAGDPEPMAGNTWLLFTSAMDAQLKGMNYKSAFGMTDPNAIPSGTSPVINYNFQRKACPW